MNTLRPLARRAADWWVVYGWGVWACAVLGVLVLGYVGFAEHFAGAHQRSFWDLTYLSLQLFVLESGNLAPPIPWELALARVLAPALAAVGVVGAVGGIIRALSDQPWRLRFARGHTIVCGLGERGAALVADLLSRPGRVVVVELGAHPEDVEASRERGAVVIAGDATDEAVLRRAGVLHASRLVALCKHDGTNAEIAANVFDMLEANGSGDLDVFAQIADSEFRGVLEQAPLSNNRRDPVRLEVIDTFQSAASLMLGRPTPPFPDCHRPDQTLLLLGMGTLGTKVLESAIETWAARDGVPLRVRVCDRKAEEKIEHLRVQWDQAATSERFASFETAAELQPWTEDLTGHEFDRGDYRGDAQFSAAFVCVHNDHLALTSALTLQRFDHEMPIVVRMSREGRGLARYLARQPERIVTLGMNEACTERSLLTPQASIGPRG